MPFSTAFTHKRVLVTGHTGFKGSWLALWLARLGAKVYGFSLPPPTQPSNFDLSRIRETLAGHEEGDIRNAAAVESALAKADPDVIFHLAAQPLVRLSYESPHDTFDVNVMGTVHLLDALRKRQDRRRSNTPTPTADCPRANNARPARNRLDGRSPCAVLVITSDKCYENREQVWGYRECDPMGGFDPYSASKGAAELVVAAYRRSFFPPARIPEHGIQLATVRAGNVIGGGDWAKDRIVTDLVDALHKNQPVPVRNPGAIRPWQHVLEPLSGYLTLAAAMVKHADPKWSDGWNFGPEPGRESTVGELVQEFIRIWGRGSWQDISQAGQPHEAGILRLCIDKAAWNLDWHPRWNSAETVDRTARWFRRVLQENADARDECMKDIEAYEKCMNPSEPRG